MSSHNTLRMSFLLVSSDTMSYFLLVTSFVFFQLTGYLSACITRDVTPFNVTQDGQTVRVTVGGLEVRWMFVVVSVYWYVCVCVCSSYLNVLLPLE